MEEVEPHEKEVTPIHQSCENCASRKGTGYVSLTLFHIDGANWNQLVEHFHHANEFDESATSELSRSIRSHPCASGVGDGVEGEAFPYGIPRVVQNRTGDLSHIC